MIDRYEPSVDMYCQIWFRNLKRPMFSKVIEYRFVWNPKWGVPTKDVMQPYLLTCKIPLRWTPMTVSIVENQCDKPTNMLKVVYNSLPENTTEKQNVVVCVKGLEFPDDTYIWRLVEWIEMTLITGADKIVLYNFHVSPRIAKVLRYYSQRGQVEVVGLTMAGWQPNNDFLRQNLFIKKKSIKRKNEVLPYNDCFYRNIYLFDFVALLDVDELIIPKQHSNWKEMIVYLKTMASTDSKSTDNIASYSFINTYFMESMLVSHQQVLQYNVFFLFFRTNVKVVPTLT